MSSQYTRPVFGQYYLTSQEAERQAGLLRKQFPSHEYLVRYDCVEDLYRVHRIHYSGEGYADLLGNLSEE